MKKILLFSIIVLLMILITECQRGGGGRSSGEDHRVEVLAGLALIVDQDQVIEEHTLVQSSVMAIPIQTA